ncbi:MAG TPA: DNA primase [Candidatus Acidoferrum sp.]|nr:DNA primase [Candidatus Acidoferrum sp.]
MEAKEEIRSRLNIEDVVGQYVQLKRAGRNFKGLSPFSSEKTASFVVSPDKHIWHDFSSNRGGDVFSFVMEVEGIDFRQALEILARKAGVDLSQYETKGDRGLAQKKERLYGLLDLAAKFYQKSLISNTPALEYVFKKRGFNKTVVAEFRIGYAPNADDALTRFLLSRGYQEADIRDAGLLVTRRARPTDMFRGRIMVPLSDGQGRVVGFTARLLADEPGAPKYINTPQTLLYDKGRQVFGLHLAKEAIRKNDFVVMVEGNLDVIASHQAGVAEVVATAGTAMTEYQLRDLGRMTANIRLAFDRDRAGIAATERAIGIASKLNLQLGIVNVPDGFKDPDELIQQEPGRWPGVIRTPQDAVEWLIDEYAKRFDPATAEGKRRVTTKALEIIGQLKDPVEQEHYLKLLARRTDTGLGSIKAKFDQAEDQEPAQLKAPKASRQYDANEFVHQDYLLATALFYPETRKELTLIDVKSFAGGLRQTVAQLIKKLGEKPFDSGLLERLHSDELCVKIKELELIAEQRFSQPADAHNEASKYAKQLQIETKRKQKAILAREMEASVDESERSAKNDAIKHLEKDIRQLIMDIKEQIRGGR